MSQHTPGPWHIAGGVQIRSERDQIAKVWMMRQGEGQANARLIAKATELYKIVRWIVGMKQGVDKNCGQYNHYTLKLGSEVMDEMARLVAEIEGEQQ